jgi:hypothetical protein
MIIGCGTGDNDHRCFANELLPACSIRKALSCLWIANNDETPFLHSK